MGEIRGALEVYPKQIQVDKPNAQNSFSYYVSKVLCNLLHPVFDSAGIFRSAKSEMGHILRFKGCARYQDHVPYSFAQIVQVQADAEILETLDAFKLVEDENDNEAPPIAEWKHPFQKGHLP